MQFYRHISSVSVLVAVLGLVFSCTTTSRQEKKTILLLATPDHFGLYTTEILKTEGFNHFITDSLSNEKVTTDYLRGFDIVILTQTSVTAAQSKMLGTYVSEGGNLIAFRPDSTLGKIFGLKYRGSTITSGYMAISDDETIGKGLTKESLQVRGEADQCEIEGSKQIARFITDDINASPAVVLNQFGKGSTLAFTFNLPESVVITRQGNPDHAGKEKDGILGLRAMDLFTDSFVDATKNTLNQSDEQMRLLTHGIEHLSISNKPLPRFWYFPDSLKCVVTLNNDGEDSKEQEFLKQFDDVENHGARMTLYVKEPEYISEKQVSSWVKRGFEISGHPDDTRQASSPDWKTMDSVYTNLQQRLDQLYGHTPMKTITNHWFVWVGNDEDGTQNFAAQAEIEEKHGIGLDCNYAHYDNGSNQGHFLGAMGYNQGNYTGSGLTMKFANSRGKVIDIYQQLNNVYDQQYMEHKDQEGYFNAFKGLMDRSIQDEVFSTISVRAHNNEYFFSEVPLMKMLDYAKSSNIPVWTELTWLEFLRAKEEASFNDIQWSGNKLSFNNRSSRKAIRDLACLVPYNYNNLRVLSAELNGKPIAFNVISIKGTHYARLLLTPGSDSQISVQYGEIQ